MITVDEEPLQTSNISTGTILWLYLRNSLSIFHIETLKKILRRYILRKRAISIFLLFCGSCFIVKNRSRDNLSDHVMKLMNMYIYDNVEVDVLPARKLMMENERVLACKKLVEKTYISKKEKKHIKDVNEHKSKIDLNKQYNSTDEKKKKNCLNGKKDLISFNKSLVSEQSKNFDKSYKLLTKKEAKNTIKNNEIFKKRINETVKEQQSKKINNETKNNNFSTCNINLKKEENKEYNTILRDDIDENKKDKDKFDSRINKETKNNKEEKANKSNFIENTSQSKKNFIYKPKHPIIIMPGISSTNLELWDSSEPNFDFRKNVWGSFGMIINRFCNKKAWIKSLLLDSETGLDPKHSKVRPANGFSSSDYILPGYWLWQKMLHNLGVLGYDQTNLHVSSYDWRLSPGNLEIRDNYFFRLKLEIEMYYKLNENVKVVMLCHSLGSITFFYFMNWVESVEKGFVDKYIESWISLASPFLGCPKSVSGMLSGESLSTNSFFEGSFHEFVISVKSRRDLLNSWGSIKTLLPKGGKAVWGDGYMVNIDGTSYNVDQITDILLNKNKYVYVKPGDFNPKEILSILYEKNTCKKKRTLCPLNIFFMKNRDELRKNYEIYKRIQSKKNYKETAEYKKLIKFCIKLLENDKDVNKWIDPLRFPLPLAPNMKIYSIYGVGKKTERAYHYTSECINHKKEKKSQGKVNNKQYSRCSKECEKIQGQNIPRINRKITSSEPLVQNGIMLCDGDGTVPSFSIGYMSYRGWKNNKKLNPSGIKTITREYDHKTDFKQLLNRGGPKTSDHVDILGNYSVTEDILRIVCGEELKDRICSDIEKKCNEIDTRLNSENQKC